MPIYIFYPQTAQGASLTFEMIELADDAAAERHCERVFADHGTAAEVVVWEGDRRVHEAIRLGAGAREATARRS